MSNTEFKMLICNGRQLRKIYEYLKRAHRCTVSRTGPTIRGYDINGDKILSGLKYSSGWEILIHEKFIEEIKMLFL